MKIVAIVLGIWLDTFLGLKWPKRSFWVLNPKVKIFFRFHDFIGFTS